MNRPRSAYPVAILGLVAAGFLALRSPSRLLANAFYSASLLCFTLGLFAVIYRGGRERAFWVGFAVCGWAYLVLTTFPILDTHVGVHLLTTTGLDLLYPRLAHRPPTVPVTSSSPWVDWTDLHLNFARKYVGNVVMVASESFMRIGHSAISLLLAQLGGLAARRMYAARDGGRAS
jgi:hypothetical protein